MVDVKFGIELELAFNSRIHSFDVGGYHANNSGQEIPNWAITSDSSLNTDKCPSSWSSSAKNAEIISDVSYGVSEMMERLEQFIDYMSVNGKYELNDVIHFNKSCGAHIHFSTWKSAENNMCFMTRYRLLRSRVFDRVRTELPHIYDSYKSNYFRSYSKEQAGVFIDKRERGEFNYTALQKGVEWRAFHLLGVKTWDDLRKMIRIGVEEIDRMLDEYYSDNLREYIEDILNDEDIRKEVENIKSLFIGEGMN